MLGYVEPRRRAYLRIPEFASLRDAGDLRVLVVPVGTARNTDGTPNLAAAVYSQVEPAQQLTGMLWSLSGRTLVSMALPANRR